MNDDEKGPATVEDERESDDRVIGRPRAKAEPPKAHVIPIGPMTEGKTGDWLNHISEIVVDYDAMAEEWRVTNIPEGTPAFIVEAIRVLRTIVGKPNPLADRQAAFLARIPEAVERARAKHPWSGDRWRALGALTGEVGELANVMNKKESQERLESEALDVIATVLRLVLEG